MAGPHEHESRIVTIDYARSALERTLLGVRSIREQLINIRVLPGSQGLAISIAVVLNRPDEQPLLINGVVLLSGEQPTLHSTVDFDVDVSRLLEEYLVTADVRRSINAAVDYGGWQFRAVLVGSATGLGS